MKTAFAFALSALLGQLAQAQPFTPCTISVAGTGQPFAYLRSTPCNNLPPIGTLQPGSTVYNLGAGNIYGCGYYYSQVIVVSPVGGANQIGWVGSHYLRCGPGGIPPAVPAFAPAAAGDAQGAPGAEAVPEGQQEAGTGQP